MRIILRMSKKSKLLAKLANFQSDANWTADEVTLLLTQNGWILTAGKSSHFIFSHAAYPHTLGYAVHGKKIKPGYLREIRIVFQAIENQKTTDK
jgi:predicted RNA binding protein YcfA (HicA-like mRNA interferase family)